MLKYITLYFSLIAIILSSVGIPSGNADEQPVDSINGGDPFMVEADNGTYYTFTTGGGVDIIKIKSYDNAEILDRKTVFYAGQNGTLRDIWAPEIHQINGKWYIIASALFNPEHTPRGTMPDNNDNREHDDYYRYTFILESKTDDIFGEYEFKNYLAPSGMNNIDGTYLKRDDKLYFVTSSYKDISHQCITITEMVNPYTLKTDKNNNTVTAELSTPVYYWETRGWRVNEGPAVLYNNDGIYILYSASGFSSGHYCMGMLTLKEEDILSSDSWKKSVTPVFTKKPLMNIYNPGHCSFLYRENGEIIMVYHATKTKDFSESPRLTYIKKVNFINNYPVF